MKQSIMRFVLTLLVIATVGALFAAPPPPGGPTNVPIDSGGIIMLIAGIFIAGKKLYGEYVQKDND